MNKVIVYTRNSKQLKMKGIETAAIGSTLKVFCKTVHIFTRLESLYNCQFINIQVVLFRRFLRLHKCQLLSNVFNTHISCIFDSDKLNRKLICKCMIFPV